MIPRRFRNGSSIALLALRCQRSNRLHQPSPAPNLLHHSLIGPRTSLVSYRRITNIATVDRDSISIASDKLNQKYLSKSPDTTPTEKQGSPTNANLNNLFQEQLLLERKGKKKSLSGAKFRSSLAQDQLLLGQRLQHLVDNEQHHEAIHTLLTSAADGVVAPFKISQAVYENASKLPLGAIVDILQNSVSGTHNGIDYAKRSPLWKAFQHYISKIDARTSRKVFLCSKYTHVKLEEMAQTHLVRQQVSAAPPDQCNVDQIINDIADTIPLSHQRQRLCNVVLSQYLRSVDSDGAKLVLDSMQHYGVRPTNVTYNILIQNELFVKDNFENANALYEQLVQDSLSSTAALYNSFLKYHLSKQNWDQVERWLDIALDSSTHNGVNRFTSGILAHALASNPDSTAMASIAERMVSHQSFKENIDDDAVYNSYLTFLLRHNRIGVARQLIHQYAHQLPRPLSVCTCNLHLHAITLSGGLVDAHDMLKKMINGQDNYPHPDVISFATVMNAYVLQNPEGVPDISSANSLVKEMVQLGIAPNTVVHSILLQGLLTTDFTDIAQARSLFNTIVDSQSGIESTMTVKHQAKSMAILYNTMMNGYFIHYRMMNHNNIPGEVYKLLRQGKRRHVQFTTATLNIWMRGLAKMFGDLKSAESMFRVFEGMGIRANERTMWYLIDTAVKKRRWEDASRWIQYAEANHIPLKSDGMQRHLVLVQDMMNKISKNSWSPTPHDLDSID